MKKQKLNTDDLIERIRTVTDKWVPLLGLDDWDIGVELAPETDDAAPGLASAADCMAHWQYQRAQIRFEETYAYYCTDTQLEKLVVHELMHCVLNQFAADGREKEEEFTAVVLTRAFQKVAASGS